MTINHNQQPASRSTLSAFICWTIILALVAITLTRNTLAYRTYAAKAATSPSEKSPITLELMGRLAVGEVQILLKSSGKDDQKVAGMRTQMLAKVDEIALTPAQKLNAIIVAGELNGAEDALDRLDQINGRLDTPELKADGEILRTIYTVGPDELSPEQRRAFRERHGWFATLAMTFGKPADDPARQTALTAAMWTAIASIAVGVCLLLALLMGIGLLITAIVLFAVGKLRCAYRPSLPIGPPVFLQTFAAWLAIWSIFGAVSRLVSFTPGMVIGGIILLVLSFLIVLWPIWRGMTWPQLRMEIGWHSGQGIFRELGWGMLGYLTGLPVIGIGMWMTTILIARSHQQPTHPIIYEIGHAGRFYLLGLYVAACVIAPLVEETMFRGALYHHLRRRWRPWWAAIVVSFIFAAIHPQGWPAIPLLGSIAIVLAMLREWRGTLLASMAAHAMNNALALTIVLLLIR